jgi:hypothetical protein
MAMRALVIVGSFLVAAAIAYLIIVGIDTSKSSASDTQAPAAGAPSPEARDLDSPNAGKRGAAVEYIVPCKNCPKRR